MSALCESRYPARQHVLALVAGLPSSKRYARNLCMLQAYFDDSTQSGEVLVFAGWLSSTKNWLEFTDAWQMVLDGPPPKAAFKMGPAARGAAGMRRAKAHYKVCSDHSLIGIGCAIPIRPLRKVIKELNLPEYLTNPYFMAWRAVFTQCMLVQEIADVWSPIEFIFDNQTEKAQIIGTWDDFMATCPRKVRKIVKSTPTFRDDEEVLPLQAADLIAWWARKRYLEDKSDMLHLFPEDWMVDFGKPAIHFAEIPENAMRKQFKADLKAHFAPRVRATFKNVPWI